MLKIKNENGVTLVLLVVTIIVLLILAGISINMGLDSVDSTKDRKLQAELETVQQACITEYTKAKQLGYLENPEERPANFIGTEIPYSSLPTLSTGWALNSEPTEAYKKYFSLSKENLENLGIKNSGSEYIVNYYTGEVYNTTAQNSSENIPLYIKSVETHQTENNADTSSFVNNEVWGN